MEEVEFIVLFHFQFALSASCLQLKVIAQLPAVATCCHASPTPPPAFMDSLPGTVSQNKTFLP